MARAGSAHGQRLGRQCLIASLAKLALSNGSLRSLRCSPGSRRLRRIRRNDPCRRISSVLDAFRRLLLQIGGANIAGADRAEQRDPGLIALLLLLDAVGLVDRWNTAYGAEHVVQMGWIRGLESELGAADAVLAGGEARGQDIDVLIR